VNDLERFVREAPHSRIHKWRHYYEIYDRHFSRFRGTDVTMVEIGVAGGGSLQMWKDYFGPQARIIGVDVKKKCLQYAQDQVEVVIGDQGDPAFWARFRETYPKVDILLDDGGHFQSQMRVTFDEMYGHLSPDGVYACEDTHCCYMDTYDGGLKREGSFIEALKDRVDELNAWHRRDGAEPTDFTRSTYAIHVYPLMVVLERRAMPQPVTDLSNSLDPDDPKAVRPRRREGGPARAEKL
jgi:23S rRNA U2552 (ribose-2'-O)-methylase RlmE/FtsJ